MLWNVGEQEKEFNERVPYKQWNDTNDVSTPTRKVLDLVRFRMVHIFSDSFQVAIDKRIASFKMEKNEAIRVKVTCVDDPKECLYNNNSIIQIWNDVYAFPSFRGLLFCLGLCSAACNQWSIIRRRYNVQLPRYLAMTLLRYLKVIPLAANTLCNQTCWINEKCFFNVKSSILFASLLRRLKSTKDCPFNPFQHSVLYSVTRMLNVTLASICPMKTA